MSSSLPEIQGFEVLALRGRGGMGQVYLAQSAVHGRVALKILDASADDGTFRRRFAREVELARSVRSEHVAAVLAADADADDPWVAMEYIDGPTLQERVRPGEGLLPDDVLLVVRDVAKALADIHAVGIVHRDLKPSNILCGQDGRARVTDFGIAAVPGATQVTATGQRIGTLAYTSPEQLSGQAATGPSDIFALGAVTYYAATGESLFGGGSEGDIVGRILAGRPAPHIITDERVSKVMEACLRRDPGARPLPPGIVEHCTRALTKAPRSAPSGDSTIVRRRPNDAQRSRSRPWLVPVMILGLLMTLGVTVMAWLITRPAPPFPSIEAQAQTYPHGNRVRLIWSIPLTEARIEAKLLVDGKEPPPPCPATVSISGECAFEGMYGTSYKAALQTTGDHAESDEPVAVSTSAQPALTLYSGPPVRDSSGATGCDVLIDALGLVPNSSYSVTLMTDAWETQKRDPMRVTLAGVTDANGSLTGAQLLDVKHGVADALGYGVRSGWIRVQLDDLIATKNPWGCP